MESNIDIIESLLLPPHIIALATKDQVVVCDVASGEILEFKPIKIDLENGHDNGYDNEHFLNPVATSRA